MSAAPRRVLVTGGASGIGGAIVERLVGQGFAVELTYHRAAAEATALCERFGAAVRGQACDLADGEAVERLARSIEEGDAWYGLVHNAGVTADALAAMIDRAAAEKVFAVNFWSMVRLVRALLRPMTAARRGRIVLVGSLAASRGSPGNAIYAASKAAMAGYLNSLVAETARRGITVNCVAPGFIDTAMLQPYASRRSGLEKQIPAGRYGKAEEVAAAVAFLMSDEAAYVNGATLPVDGGLGAVLPVQR
jgi:3-oxoacyl-[acyl-carrier protein] reductase